MFPAMGGKPAIVSSQGIAKEFADSFTEVVCGSPEELGVILSGASMIERGIGNRSLVDS